MKFVFQVAAGIVVAYISIIFLNVFVLVPLARGLAQMGAGV